MHYQCNLLVLREFVLELVGKVPMSLNKTNKPPFSIQVIMCEESLERPQHVQHSLMP